MLRPKIVALAALTSSAREGLKAERQTFIAAIYAWHSTTSIDSRLTEAQTRSKFRSAPSLAA
jgi:hypothetical protein